MKVIHAVPPRPEFPGFPAFRANVTFVPIQFFTTVLPYGSRGTVRLVGYALRKLLGWVDAHGQPTREQIQFTYRELIEAAGLSRGGIAKAFKEVVTGHLLRCVKSPVPAGSGQAAQSAIYELCWDAAGRYTDTPAHFRGFYYPAAALVEEREGNQVVSRPKAARKNIPNAFFDVVLPREPLAVIRVVGALLFYSIQWGPGGERKESVTCSITELSRLTKLSRHHVHEAVLAARQRGYIEQVAAGCFDPAAGQASAAATYGIRWAPEVAPTKPGAERFKKVNGASVQKGVREQFNKVNGERFNKVNDIRIKKELKTETTTTAAVAAAPVTTPAAAASGCELLIQTGFDKPTAQQLAAQRTLEVVQRQIAWLPLRHTTHNRLGLLRRAIEQDWPKPEGAAENPGHEAGREFARHYYAAYHGYTGEAATVPFPKDVPAAAKFIERLPASRRPGVAGVRVGPPVRRLHAAAAARRSQSPAEPVVCHRVARRRVFTPGRERALRPCQKGPRKVPRGPPRRAPDRIPGLPAARRKKRTASHSGPLRGFRRTTRPHPARDGGRVVSGLRCDPRQIRG